MFPFLFMTLRRIMKGVRHQQQQDERHRPPPRHVTDVNHNRNNDNAADGTAAVTTLQAGDDHQLQQPPRRRRQHLGGGIWTRKRKAYVIMVVCMMGLLIPVSLLIVRHLLLSLHERTHPRLVWQAYRPNHSHIQSERLSNMGRYDFPHNKTGVDKRFRLSLREFADVYDAKWPVIVRDPVTRWRAYKWTDDFLIKNYGKEQLRVKNVKNGVESADVVSLSYFIRHLDDGQANNWNYVEDEHFLALRQALRSDVGETVYTLDDMFRHFPDSVRPWDSMLLWGTAYSRSPLHMDPYNWTGTNAVLRGHKKWKLYPPGQDDVMYIKENQRCHFPLDCVKYNSLVDAFDPYRLTRWPRFEAARYVEVDQYTGEMLFIPSGWYHQAYNVEPTLAISGQLMNERNYMAVLEEILRANPIPVHNLPSTFYTLSPDHQVRMILSKIPKELHDRGVRITKEARKPDL